MDAKNQPTDLLHPDVKEWAEENGSEAETVTELLEEDNEDVRLDLLEGIQRVNRRAISNAQKVHKFMIAPSDFSLAGGELTPTMKMKRHVIEEKYEKKIEQMYEHETQSSMWQMFIIQQQVFPAPRNHATPVSSNASAMPFLCLVKVF